MAPREKRRLPDEEKRKLDRSLSIDLPFEEAVGDLLKVKKPEGKTKSKKARSRDRKKRNI